MNSTLSVAGLITSTGGISGGAASHTTGSFSGAVSTGALTVTGTITASSDITAYSDAKLKTNVKTIDNALELVGKMRGVSYDWIESGDASVGVIAQEMKEALPQVVKYDAATDTHSVAYGNIVGVLIEAVKAQQVQIEELSAQLAQLKK
jgi:hypothetical protein